MTERLTLLGSTGSIGTQTLEVARNRKIKVDGLAAGSNIDLLEKQIREFSVAKAAVFDEEKAAELKLRVRDTDCKILSGEEGVIEVSRDNESDTVLNSIVGIAGLKPTLEIIKAKKTLALANKESLVTGGVLVNNALKENGVKLLPVDSEHSAIFQSLMGVPEGALKRIVLTASGGPFFGKTKEELSFVTVKDALKHPNWSMGQKITVDSATLMNKGLEVIEAVHLFSVSADNIDVYVHRQSILHSGIELKDGAVIAQLGVPDMKLPIQFALTYPERYPCSKRLDLFEAKCLTFEKPDTDTFRCLKICIDAVKSGGLKPTAANGANEEAVRLFLEEKIKFTDIADLVEEAVKSETNCGEYTVKDVFDCDRRAREKVLSLI